MGRYCKTCQTSHEKPTGKHCRKITQDQVGDNQESGMSTAEKTLELLTALTDRVHSMEIRMGTMERSNTNTDNTSDPGEQESEQDDVQAPQHTPQSVRNDRATMDTVAERQAEWGLTSEDWQGPGSPMIPWRQGTKKSGAVIKGNDNVKTRIDWPHFYIRQGPRRTMPTYEELSSTEFALGFLRMIRDPGSQMDTPRMLDVLAEVLEDTVDFGWENARNYYLLVGQDVEQSRMTWNDKQRMMQLRMTHSRVVLPPNDSPKQKGAGAVKAKCCAPFQRGTCDKEGDHGAFKHACDFCYRVKSKLFPHAEMDCKSKKFDMSKNGQRGDRE